MFSRKSDECKPLADGEAVAKSQVKKLAKTHAAQKKEHEKYLAKCAADGVAALGV
jgi:cysteinyl-tRNA synthetase